MAVKEMPARSTKEQPLPPDESTWKRYSPHHEALVSGVGSLTLHGLVVGILVLAGWMATFSWNDETRRPPSMDVVQLTGDGGDLFGGGQPAPLGTAEGDDRKEAVPENPVQVAKAPVTEDSFPLVPKEVELNIPDATVPDVPAKDDAGTVLENIGKETKQPAKQTAKKIVKTATRVQGGKGPRGRPDGRVGAMGNGGAGGGNGFGNGPGGFGGPQATTQQIFAQRWRFDLSGSGREHAEKLEAVGVILVIYDQLGDTAVVRDLKRRPVELKRENLAQFRDSVKWSNRKPESLAGLATELGLGFIPAQVTILLPKDREQKMAQAEAAFAKSQGRPVTLIIETWFDFRLRNGTFEPVVIKQK